MFFYEQLVGILTSPLAASAGDTGGALYLTTVYEGFLARIKISLIAGFVHTLPLHINNLLVVIFPALTSREKRIASIVVFSGFVLTVLSLYYGYRFLTGSSFVVEGTSYLLGFTRNIFYIVQFFTAVIMIFQLPLLMIPLISLNLISVKSAFKGGRYVIVAAMVLSAILTPPDVVSQVMITLPLVLLYYLGLLVARIFRLGGR